MNTSASIISAIADHVGLDVVDYDDLFDWTLEQTALAADAMAAGADVTEHFEAMLIDAGIFLLSGSDVRRLDLLLDSVVFTHRLTADEIATDRMEMLPDLMVIDWDDVDSFETPAGVRIGIEETGDGVVLDGPTGWLGGFASGDLVELRRERGVLTVDRTGEPTGIEPHAELLGRLFESMAGDGATIPGEMLLLTMLSEHDVFRQPTAPVLELIRTAGLETDGERIGRPGADFESPVGEQLDEVIGSIVQRWGMDECCVDALLEVIEAADRPVEDGRRLCERLGHHVVALGFRDWLRSVARLGNDDILEWFDQLIADSGRRAAPALLVRAAIHDQRDDVLAAEHDLETAHAYDPDYAPAALELSTFLIMRSEYRRATTLLNRAGSDGSGVSDLFGDVEMDAGSVGRNDPCPCGSGRKFKVCHLGKPLTTPEALVKALAMKLRVSATDPAVGATPFLAFAVVATAGDTGALERLLDDRFFLDLAIFDGTGLADFLHKRAELLPEAERSVLDGWVGRPLELTDLAESDGAQKVTLVRRSTGERLDVFDAGLAQDHQVGDHIVARLLPVGGALYTSGPVLCVEPEEMEVLEEAVASDDAALAVAQWYLDLTANE